MEKNSRYKCMDYWNERYKEEESFEWFGEYSRFREVLRNIINQTDRILTLGCGNSKMSEEMYLDNYQSIVNTDYSEVIINLMQKRCESLKKMTWEVMDINNLKYEPESFECILEKGTLDALLVDEKSPWNLSEENSIKMDKILERISQLLKDNGVFISITFAQPHFRKPMYALDKYNWSIETHTVGETFHYFIYVMRKGQKLDPSDKEFYCRRNLNKSDSNNNHTLSKDSYVEEDFNEDFLLQIQAD